MSNTEKSKALFDLFKAEKRHEERTRHMLDDLEHNSQALQKAKVQLIEKLLDLGIKDAMTDYLQADDAASLIQFSEKASALTVARRQNDPIRDEITANITKSRDEFPDGFIANLDRMLQMSDSDARSDVANMVSKYLDPHIAALKKRKRVAAQQEALTSVAVACSQVRQQRLREAEVERNVRIRQESESRAKRVHEAMSMFRKNLGDISALLFVQPTDYKTDIGKQEAETFHLRRTIMSQRAEEERLIQERNIQMQLIDATHAKLAAEVDALQQKHNLLQRELDAKSVELREMQEAARAGGGTGQWATNTIQLEKDLVVATEDESKLRQDVDQLKRAESIILQEKEALDNEVADAIQELRTAQDEHRTVLERIEQKLATARSAINGFRSEERRLTKDINDLRHRMVHRREDIRRQKRAFRENINTILAQLTIEDHMQSLLMARSLELHRQMEKVKAQADQNVASLQSQLQKVSAELTAKAEQIRSYAAELANYFAGGMVVKEIKLTPVQLQSQIDAVQKEAERLEKEAAEQVAAVSSRVDNNMRENEVTLKRMGWFAVLQEDVQPEGVDIAATPVDELQRMRSTLYSELTQRSYREGKYSQTIRMLRDRLARRQRGEALEPLTLRKRVPLADRRARAEATQRYQHVRDEAQDHLRSFQHQAQVPMQDNGTAEGRSMNAAALAAFRTLVIQHIKREIQPLYDSNQISKARFVDVVHRVSSWYLQNHIPTTELSHHNMSVINRKIQEILTWQDEQRMQLRLLGNGSASPAPSGSGM